LAFASGTKPVETDEDSILRIGQCVCPEVEEPVSSFDWESFMPKMLASSPLTPNLQQNYDRWKSEKKPAVDASASTLKFPMELHGIRFVGCPKSAAEWEAVKEQCVINFPEDGGFRFDDILLKVNLAEAASQQEKPPTTGIQRKLTKRDEFFQSLEAEVTREHIQYSSKALCRVVFAERK